MITIERLARPASDADLRMLAGLLLDAVESGAAVSFVAPLSRTEAEAWWRRTLDHADPRAVFLVARSGAEIAGGVQLHPAWAPNQPHRAEIVKLIVHRAFRGAGLGRRLMEAAEDAARQAGWTLLTLDAKRGAPAERLYRALGWTAAGTIPDFAVDPEGPLHDAVFFYKKLGPDAERSTGRARERTGDGERARIRSVEAEYRRYRTIAEAAMAQVPDDRLSEPAPGGGNSIAVLVWHLSGNLRSRFTDFLDSDGEKPWRRRDEEFAARTVSRAELLEKWARGWDALMPALAALRDEDGARTVTIRGRDFAVYEALDRSLAHVGYHVGQIVFLARTFRGEAWEYLSIPPGKSAAYNADPAFEKPDEHEARLRGRRADGSQ